MKPFFGAIVSCLIALVVTVSLPTGCTKQELAAVEAGIPQDATAVGCVIATAAATDGDLAAVAAACGVDVIVAADILYAALDGGHSDAGAASPLAKSPAAKEALAMRISRASAAFDAGHPAGW